MIVVILMIKLGSRQNSLPKHC